ncbi:MAG: SDR family NAD(P)-dependent oxidoreductase, partial [Bacteroidia bacterium]
MSLKQKYGRLAMVAGASEGIGAAFSELLAKEGLDLVLIARRKEPLDKLAVLLRGKYGIKVDCISCDLSASDAASRIKEATKGREVNLLVYNAALSYIGRFEGDSIEHHNAIAQTNMITPMNMLHLFGEEMLKKGKGAIILMASLAGFQGSGFLAAYAASKAFTRVLAESLWYEWKERGVDVIACCAGATSTANFINTNPGKSGFMAPAVQIPEEVASECIKQLGKRPSLITGRGN